MTGGVVSGSVVVCHLKDYNITIWKEKWWYVKIYKRKCV